MEGKKFLDSIQTVNSEIVSTNEFNEQDFKASVLESHIS